jgi:molecular chaperone IbpA
MTFLNNTDYNDLLNKFSIFYERDGLYPPLLCGKNDYYPPYNIVRVSDTKYTIELAIAGFTKENLSLEVEKSVLYISGELLEAADKEYIHKGISTRKFKKAFRLSEYVQVESAKVESGILTISLVKIVPEQDKPKKVDIQ